MCLWTLNFHSCEPMPKPSSWSHPNRRFPFPTLSVISWNDQIIPAIRLMIASVPFLSSPDVNQSNKAKQYCSQRRAFLFSRYFSFSYYRNRSYLQYDKMVAKRYWNDTATKKKSWNMVGVMRQFTIVWLNLHSRAKYEICQSK